MFFVMLSIIWTGGYYALVYVLAQQVWSLNLLDASQHSKLLWTLPLWLIGEVIMFNWFKKKKSVDIVKQAVQDHPFVPVKGFVPHAMPSQGKSTVYMPVSAPVQTVGSTPTFAQPTAPVATQPNPVKLLEQEAVAEITKLAEAKGATAFPHVLLQNIMLPLTVSSDIQALLFKFLPFAGTWQVEQTENISDCIWKNGEKTLTPFKELISAQKILSEMEPSADVKPVLVLLDGSVANAPEVRAYVEKNKAYLVILKPVEGSPLKTVSELFDEVFIQPIPPMPEVQGGQNATQTNA